MFRVLIPVLGPFIQNGNDPLIMVADFKDQSCDCSGSEQCLVCEIDCLRQVRQDKRAAKEKRREEARMREVSNTKYVSPQTIGILCPFLGGEQ